MIISSAELSQFFGKDKTPREMKDQIMALLGEWKEKQPPELGKGVKKMEMEKYGVALDTVSRAFPFPVKNGEPRKVGDFVGRGGARERAQFSPEAETEQSGLCDAEALPDYPPSLCYPQGATGENPPEPPPFPKIGKGAGGKGLTASLQTILSVPIPNTLSVSERRF